MANYPPCLFRWHILNPFVPWENKEAIFYYGSPFLTPWKVTLTTQPNMIDLWPFRFSLEKIRLGGDDNMLAAQLGIKISINGSIMENVKVDSYYFSIANRFRYEFLGRIVTFPPGINPCLTIEVQLALPNQVVVNQAIGIDPSDNDRRQLSTDLRQLFNNYPYFNLKIVPRNSLSLPYCVHSYIIRTRWSNFFSEHPVDRNTDRAVEVQMSDGILRELLIYLYSGVVDTGGPILRNANYRTELFRVIDRYKIHHLYKVFAADDSQQIRATTKDLGIDAKLIPMDGHQSLNNLPYSWTVNAGTDSEIAFRIVFNIAADPPLFSYSLTPRGANTIFVHVNLVLVTKQYGYEDRTLTVHSFQYEINNTRMALSGASVFSGKPSVINPFFDAIRGKGETNRSTKRYIRCILYTSDGKAVIDVLSDGVVGFQGDTVRLKVLSDHMHQMLLGGQDTDLKIQCRSPQEGLIYLNSPFHLHKSIFTTRIPQWRVMLGDVPEESDIPDAATCSMSTRAFHHLLNYIYSAKVFDIPDRISGELEDFASQGGLVHLSEYLNHRRRLG